MSVRDGRKFVRTETRSSPRNPFPGSPGTVVAACPCVARGIDRHPRVVTITNVAKRCKGDRGKRQCGAASHANGEMSSESTSHLSRGRNFEIRTIMNGFYDATFYDALPSPYPLSKPRRIPQYVSRRLLAI